MLNAVIAQVLLRWMLAMSALHRSCYLGFSSWRNGCLVTSSDFMTLPVLLLPHLRMTLVAFWSAECQFECQQRPFSETWYLIYPAIVKAMLCYYSLLNTVGRLLRLRVRDVLFGMSIGLLCLVH